jgi:hypothetical protein
MTVYVDDMRAAAVIGGTRSTWSHLIADSSDELAAFATRLALKPGWVQFPGTFREHYDVTESVRRRAIEQGAIPISMRDVGRLLRKRVALV